jgi:MFS family permease
MFSTDFVEVIMIQGPPTMLPFIGDEMNFTSATSAQITAGGTAAIACSKMFAGPVVDVLGGRLAVVLTMGSVSGLSLVFGLSPNVYMVGAILFFMYFMNAPLW